MKKGLMLFVFILLLLGCIHVGNYWKPSQVQPVIDTILTIETTAMVKNQSVPEFVERSQRSAGISLGNGYILLLKHCVFLNEVDQIRTTMGFFVYYNNEIKDYVRKIGDIEFELIGTKDDIALLYSEKWQDTNVISWGDSDLLAIGEKILSVGYTEVREINVRDGILSSKKATAWNLDEADGFYSKNMSIISIPTSFGDSGTPVMAYQRGKLKIVGIIAATTNYHGVSFMYDGNYILRTIEEIKEKAAQ